MGKKLSLTVAKRSEIITLHKESYSVRKICKKLKVARSTVQDTIKRWKETGIFEDKKRSGRPRKTTKAEDNSIILMSKRNRRLTAPEITSGFNRSHSKSISLTTTKRRLRQAGLSGRITVRKPLLRIGNKKKRLQWAIDHQNWTEGDWGKVLWTDESKFELFGQRRRIYIRRTTKEKMIPECLVPTIKHGGGSVMVWGCFSSAGVGDLVKIEGIMKKEQYKTILENNAIPSGLRTIGRSFVFMQDNDPKHTSKLCKNYIKEQEDNGVLKNMTWPAQSPDLNPIELLWEELDRKVRQKCPTSKEHLWQILEESWLSITPEIINKLINRMPRIAKKVIKTRGLFFDEKTV